MLYTKGLLMPVARFKKPDGAYQIVQLPGTTLRGDAVLYDEKIHKGNLVCKCCDAPVHFNPGSKTISGDNLRGPRPHFASNRKDYHAEDCTVDLSVEEGRKASEYDQTKGYRLHINTQTLREEFGGKSRPYGRRSHPHWKILINNTDLAGREPFAASNAENLQRLIGKKPEDRMRNAVVVYGGSAIAMEDFYFRLARREGEDKRYSRRQPAFLHLVDMLQNYGDNQLMLVEVDLTTPEYSKGKIIAARGHTLRGRKKDENGYTHDIVTCVIAGKYNQDDFARVLGVKQRILTLATVKMGTAVNDETKTVLHTLNVRPLGIDWVSPLKLDLNNRLVKKKEDPSPQMPIPF